MSQTASNADKPVSQIVLLINITELLFVTSTTTVRNLTHNRGLSVMEVAFARNFLNTVFSFLPLWWSGKGLFEGFDETNKKAMILRTLLGNIGYFLHTMTFKLLPLGIGNVIILSNPFAVALMSSYMFGDLVTALDLASIAVSFGGLVIMMLALPKPQKAELADDLIVETD